MTEFREICFRREVSKFFDIGTLIKIQNLAFWIMNPRSSKYKMELVIDGICVLQGSYAARSGIILLKIRANISFPI